MKTNNILNRIFLLLTLAAGWGGSAWADTQVIATMKQLVEGATNNNGVTTSVEWNSSETRGAVYSFSGSNQYFGSITNQAMVDAFGGDKIVTVAAWVRGNTDESRPSNCFFGYGEAGKGVKFMLNGTKLRATTKNRKDFGDQDIASSLTIGEWHLVAFAFPGHTSTNDYIRYYYGVSDRGYWTMRDASNSNYKMNIPSTQQFAIGSANCNSSSEPFNGMISNLTIITSDDFLENSEIFSRVGNAPLQNNTVWLTYNYKVGDDIVDSEEILGAVGQAYPAPRKSYDYYTTGAQPGGSVAEEGTHEFDINLEWNGPFQEGRYYTMHSLADSRNYVCDGTVAWFNGSVPATAKDPADVWQFERVPHTADLFMLKNVRYDKYATIPNTGRNQVTFQTEPTPWGNDGNATSYFRIRQRDNTDPGKFGMAHPYNDNCNIGSHVDGKLGSWAGTWNNNASKNVVQEVALITYNVVQEAETLGSFTHKEDILATPPYFGVTANQTGLQFPSFVTINSVVQNGDAYDINVTLNESGMPFSADGTTVYSLQIKDASGYVKSNLGYGSAPNANTPNTYEYGWKITGDWYHGFYFQNADTDMFLNPGTNNNVTQITLVANQADAKPLELIAANNTSFWALRTKGTSNCYLNKRTNLGTHSNADAGCHLTFTALTDLHYLATYTYMWNGGVVHEVGNLRKQRDDAFGATIPAGYTSSGNPTVDGHEMTSVHGVGPYVFTLKKNTKLTGTLNAEVTALKTHAISSVFPGLKVVDFEGHDLVAGSFSLTVGSAGDYVRIDGDQITGKKRTDSPVTLGIDLTAPALALYNQPTGDMPTIMVLKGLARIYFREPLIILDNSGVVGAVESRELTKADFDFEPTSAKALFNFSDVKVTDTDGTDLSLNYRTNTGGHIVLKNYAITAKDLIVQPQFTSDDFDVENDPTTKLRVYDLLTYTQLSTDLTTVHGYKIGDKLGYYTYTGNEAAAATNEACNQYWSELYLESQKLRAARETDEGVNADLAALAAKVTAFKTDVETYSSLNMPVAGKTLLTIDGSTDIYYYDDTQGLLAYTGDAAANDASVAHGAYHKQKVTFEAKPNVDRSQLGRYGIKVDGANYNAYDDHALTSAAALPYTLHNDGNGYGTLYAPVALRIPEGIRAYVDVKEEAPNGSGVAVVRLAPLASIIPAQTAVVLKGTAGQTYSFPVTTSGYEKQNEFFRGTYPTQSIPGSYTLQPNGGGVGFYTWDSAVTGFRAYIPDNAPAGGRVRAYVLDFGDGTETGIETIFGTTSPATPAYDLSGRQIQPTQRGLYLQQGRKVLRN